LRGWAGLAALDVGVEDRELGQKPAAYELAQDAGQHQVRRSEAPEEVVAPIELGAQNREAVFEGRQGRRPTPLDPGFSGVKDVELHIGQKVRLDRVDRGHQPAGHPGPAGRVLRGQALGLLHQVKHDGGRFEHLDLLVPIGRDLAEGLPAAVGLPVPVREVDQNGLVGQAGLLQGPAHAQVAHEALGQGRNPVEGGDLDRHGRALQAVMTGLLSS
jgi:hypothetical protein